MKYIAKNWLFLVPLAVFAIFYLLQNVVGMAQLPHQDLVQTFMAILALSVVSYAVAYHLVPDRWFRPLQFVKVQPPVIEAFAIATVGAYLLLLITASVTTDGVALIEAFKGASAAELATLRETFLRTRTGGWQVLNYFYAILSNAIVPVAVTYAFHKRLRWRHVALVVLILGLTITLSKGAIASAALPLLALFLMERRYFAAFGAILMLGAVVISLYFLASGRLGEFAQQPAPLQPEVSIQSTEPAPVPTDTAEAQAPEVGVVPVEVAPAAVAETSPLDTPAVASVPAPPEAPQVQNSSAVPAEYNVTGRDDQISLAINRIFWIPYVTAIDWLRYQRDHLGGELLLGRSIKPVAAVLGWEPVSLEREVASIQWGQNDTGTASSNAVFFVDAWINFGILGVALYSALFALTIKLIVETGSKPLIAAASVPVYTACFLSLPPMYLSGGLVFFILMALVAPDGRTEAATAVA